MAYYEVRIAHLIRFLSSFTTLNEKEVYYTRAVCLRNEKSYFPYIGVDIQMEAISKCWFVAPLNIGLALIQIGTNIPTFCESTLPFNSRTKIPTFISILHNRIFWIALGLFARYSVMRKMKIMLMNPDEILVLLSTSVIVCKNFVWYTGVLKSTYTYHLAFLIMQAPVFTSVLL